jgi:hypothetical protein
MITLARNTQTRMVLRFAFAEFSYFSVFIRCDACYETKAFGVQP